MKLAFTLFLMLFSLSVHAEGLPDIADASQASVSPEQEKELGEQVMRNIRSDPSYLDDPQLSQYLDGIGQRLIVNSTMPGMKLHFFMMQDNTINAFALPGGFIGVNTGLLLAAESESELASVLSHEIGHITQGHYARMMTETKGSSIESLAALALAILTARGGSQVSEAALAAAQANSIQSQIDVTREHEEEADRVGLSVLAKSGFDPRAMATFFERLQKSTRLYDNNAPVYLHDHPLTSQRIAAIENRVQNYPYRQVLDSPDFWLLREKLAADQGNAEDALSFFETSLKLGKYENETAYRFGLCEALYRLGQFRRANQELSKVEKIVGQDPVIATMQGRLLLALGQSRAALAYYRNALSNYPDYRALIYDYAGALIDNGMAGQALDLVASGLQKDSKDIHLYQLRARSYAFLGMNMQMHAAQAEVYYLSGNLPGAIDQLQLAEKADDGDFYTRSMVEARLREFQKKAASLPVKKKRRF